MKTIEAKVQVDTNRSLTIQLPADVQAGEYDVVLRREPIFVTPTGSE